MLFQTLKTVQGFNKSVMLSTQEVTDTYEVCQHREGNISDKHGIRTRIRGPGAHVYKSTSLLV